MTTQKTKQRNLRRRLDPKSYYMNPNTGSVAIGQDWVDDYRNRTDEERDLSLDEWTSCLVEMESEVNAIVLAELRRKREVSAFESDAFVLQKVELCRSNLRSIKVNNPTPEQLLAEFYREMDLQVELDEQYGVDH